MKKKKFSSHYFSKMKKKKILLTLFLKNEEEKILLTLFLKNYEEKILLTLFLKNEEEKVYSCLLSPPCPAFHAVGLFLPFGGNILIKMPNVYCRPRSTDSRVKLLATYPM